MSPEENRIADCENDEEEEEDNDDDFDESDLFSRNSSFYGDFDEVFTFSRSHSLPPFETVSIKSNPLSNSSYTFDNTSLSPSRFSSSVFYRLSPSSSFSPISTPPPPTSLTPPALSSIISSSIISPVPFQTPHSMQSQHSHSLSSLSSNKTSKDISVPSSSFETSLQLLDTSPFYSPSSSTSSSLTFSPNVYQQQTIVNTPLPKQNINPSDAPSSISTSLSSPSSLGSQIKKNLFDESSSPLDLYRSLEKQFLESMKIQSPNKK
jgi:hypothetical protein